MPDYFKNFKPDRDKQIVYWKFSFDVFPAMGACFFSFTNHFSIVGILKIMRKEGLHTNYSAILRS